MVGQGGEQACKVLGSVMGNVLPGDRIRPRGRSIYQGGVQVCKVLRSILEEFRLEGKIRPRGKSIYQGRELACIVLGFDIEVDHILVVDYNMKFRHTCKVVKSIMRAMWSAQSRMQDDQLVYTCNVASSITHARWPSGSSL
ncbi:unnamed protein product [Prunus armeniaca]|uniref:Uncharacterized protein n=1 Tax=Prunus armeniaca TaxID=36596 RepID=A0A6J5V7W2_PRUAR|nr:unnamed protein product [Prunus armeniaca]